MNFPKFCLIFLSFIFVIELTTGRPTTTCPPKKSIWENDNYGQKEDTIKYITGLGPDQPEQNLPNFDRKITEKSQNEDPMQFITGLGQEGNRDMSKAITKQKPKEKSHSVDQMDQNMDHMRDEASFSSKQKFNINGEKIREIGLNNDGPMPRYEPEPAPRKPYKPAPTTECPPTTTICAVKLKYQKLKAQPKKPEYYNGKQFEVTEKKITPNMDIFSDDQLGVNENAVKKPKVNINGEKIREIGLNNNEPLPKRHYEQLPKRETFPKKNSADKILAFEEYKGKKPYKNNKNNLKPYTTTECPPTTRKSQNQKISFGKPKVDQYDGSQFEVTEKKITPNMNIFPDDQIGVDDRIDYNAPKVNINGEKIREIGLSNKGPIESQYESLPKREWEPREEVKPAPRKPTTTECPSTTRRPPPPPPPQKEKPKKPEYYNGKQFEVTEKKITPNNQIFSDDFDSSNIEQLPKAKQIIDKEKPKRTYKDKQGPSDDGAADMKYINGDVDDIDKENLKDNYHEVKSRHRKIISTTTVKPFDYEITTKNLVFQKSDGAKFDVVQKKITPNINIFPSDDLSKPMSSALSDGATKALEKN